MKRLRRTDDAFTYEVVQVGTFEDAIIGTICNHNLQAVVIRDGFEYRSRHDVPVLREFLLRHLNGSEASTAPGALATALAQRHQALSPGAGYLPAHRSRGRRAGRER